MGYKPQITTAYQNKKAREIDPHLLDTPHRSEIIITSYLDKPVIVDLTMIETDREVKQAACGLVDKSPIEINKRNDELSMSIQMEPKEVKCLEIRWM